MLTTESGCNKVIFGLIFCYLAGMYFLFDPSWADTALVAQLVEKVGSIVPMVRELQNLPNYSNYWGLVYSGAWLLAPVTGYLGWRLGGVSSRMNDKMAALASQSPIKLLFLYLFIAGLCVFAVYWPIDANYLGWKDRAFTGGFIRFILVGGCIMYVPTAFVQVTRCFVRHFFMKQS